MTQHDAIHPADRPALYEKDCFAAAIRSGDLLFALGQVGSREDGSPEPDFAAQAHLTFRNLAEMLAASGCTFADILDVTSFHTDLEAQFETVMAAREEALAGSPVTNWTAVMVNWLAGFDVDIKVLTRIPAAESSSCRASARSSSGPAVADWEAGSTSSRVRGTEDQA